MTLRHSHAFPPDPLCHWQPVSNGATIFQNYRPGEPTIRALTLTQVELHKLRTAHSRLLVKSQQNEDDWQKSKQQMEEEMRQMQVRSSEAERLFNEQHSKITAQLQDTQNKLKEIVQDHMMLREASSGKIKSLSDQLQDLQTSCDDLQARKRQLQKQLEDACVSVELGVKAQRRVAELETAIAVVQDKAKEMVINLEKQRDSANSQCGQLAEQLLSTQGDLDHQSSLRQQSEEQMLKLAIERQRLKNALEIERLINEPLRNTDYASTTLAHVMRSAARPSVANQSSPLAQHSASQGITGSMSRDSIIVARPGHEHEQITVQRPKVEGTFADRDLSRLGRSWATTTPTGGLPHLYYLDNLERYRQHYDRIGDYRGSPGSMGRATVTAQGRVTGRPVSAPRQARVASSRKVFLTPQKGPKQSPEKAGFDTGSSGRTVAYWA